MVLELTKTERDLLVKVLHHELTDLGPEIRHTDDRAYRQDLKEERRLVSHLYERLAKSE